MPPVTCPRFACAAALIITASVGCTRPAPAPVGTVAAPPPVLPAPPAPPPVATAPADTRRAAGEAEQQRRAAAKAAEEAERRQREDVRRQEIRRKYELLPVEERVTVDYLAEQLQQPSPRWISDGPNFADDLIRYADILGAERVSDQLVAFAKLRGSDRFARTLGIKDGRVLSAFQIEFARACSNDGGLTTTARIIDTAKREGVGNLSESDKRFVREHPDLFPGIASPR